MTDSRKRKGGRGGDLLRESYRNVELNGPLGAKEEAGNPTSPGELARKSGGSFRD